MCDVAGAGALKGCGGMKSKYYEEIPEWQDGVPYDPDASPLAWAHYRKVYTEERWPLLGEFDMVHVDTYNELLHTWYKQDGRLYAPWSRCDEDGYPELILGGDTEFNFNSAKYYLYKYKLKLDKRTLEMFYANHLVYHSPVNFSLMPATGNLQGVKGGSANVFDRLDVFVKWLHAFYIGENDFVLSKARGKNRKRLENYLNSFAGESDERTYDYCAKVYFMEDRMLVRRVLEDGAKPMESAADAVRYMELAQACWAARAERWEKRYSD